MLTFAREGSEVKSNTNKVETLIVAFMDGTGPAPSEGEEGTREAFKGGRRKSTQQGRVDRRDLTAFIFSFKHYIILLELRILTLVV